MTENGEFLMKRNRLSVSLVLALLAMMFALASCATTSNGYVEPVDDEYRNFYEIFVWSFLDTDNDGIGDLNGVTEKLPYIKENGFNGIWLMPITVGTSYHKYDVENYYDVDPQFGTLEDMRNLVAKAHALEIDIIIDLVVNHSSSDNPWFKEACAYLVEHGQPGGQYGDYYNFSQSQKQGYQRVPSSAWYYECQFTGTMPDLNLDSQAVRDEVKSIMEFWLSDVGVDGFRLDAVTSFYTNSTAKSIEFLSYLNDTAKAIKPDCYIVGEAWLGNNKAVREYYASGIDSFFCFPLATGTGLVADALKDKGNHIITTKIEHHAIIHTCMYLQKYHGIEVTYLDVDEEGFVSPEDLEEAITDKTILISIMMVNNEIGTVEPIKELAAVAKKHGILFHTDAVQALGNLPIDVKDLGVDLLSMSAHKIYGPKGIGALYKRKGVNMPSFVHGGAQENRKRAGKENTTGIVGFGKAAELARVNLDDHIAHSRELRQYLWDQIRDKIDHIRLNGPADFDKRHPANLNVSFSYIEGESILLLLDAAGVSVSTGSACSSGSLDISHVLSSIKVPMEVINGTVRFTVGDFTSKEDIDYAVEALVKVVDTLRRVSPVTGKEGW